MANNGRAWETYGKPQFKIAFDTVYQNNEDNVGKALEAIEKTGCFNDGSNCIAMVGIKLGF